MLGWLPGMSARDAADREIGYGQLNDRRTGIKDDGWNWQDDIGAFLGGYSKEDVEGIAQEKADAKLIKAVDAKYGITGTELAGLGQKGSYSGVEGLTEQEINNQLLTDASRLKAAQTSLTIPNFDVTSLSPNATTTQILQAGRAQTDKNRTDAEDKVQQETLRQESRQDARLASEKAERDAIRASETAYQDALLGYQEKRDAANLEYQQNRDDLKFGQEMQIAQMNMADRKAERADRREDRLAAQRQQSIMALIKGLSQLGAGMAI